MTFVTIMTHRCCRSLAFEIGVNWVIGVNGVNWVIEVIRIDGVIGVIEIIEVNGVIEAFVKVGYEYYQEI